MAYEKRRRHVTGITQEAVTKTKRVIDHQHAVWADLQSRLWTVREEEMILKIAL